MLLSAILQSTETMYYILEAYIFGGKAWHKTKQKCSLASNFYYQDRLDSAMRGYLQNAT